jgi:hypothetical protein
MKYMPKSDSQNDSWPKVLLPSDN